MERAEWVALAGEALLEMVDVSHAVVSMEARAKACDRAWDDYPTFDPDILSAASDSLLAEGHLRIARRTTKGGRRVDVLHMADLRGRETEFEKVAARKRALQARYLGWTLGNKRKPEGVIGPAAESVVRQSLLEARDAGYVPVNDGRHVQHLLGANVAGGTLDAAAHLLSLEDGKPVPIVLVIEVKNVRGWIYPNSQELFQLLDKAARLQASHPDQAILPVLVCRRLHWTAGKMAKELGFFGTALWAQYILPSVSKRLVDEVRDELGYEDLIRSGKKDADLVRAFRTTIPREGLRLARRWAVCGSQLADHYRVLRQDLGSVRPAAMRELFDAVRALDTWTETWPLQPTHLGF